MHYYMYIHVCTTLSPLLPSPPLSFPLPAFLLPRYEGSCRDSAFSVGLQGVREEDVGRVTEAVWSTLETVAKYVHVYTVGASECVCVCVCVCV